MYIIKALIVNEREDNPAILLASINGEGWEIPGVQADKLLKPPLSTLIEMLEHEFVNLVNLQYSKIEQKHSLSSLLSTEFKKKVFVYSFHISGMNDETYMETEGDLYHTALFSSYPKLMPCEDEISKDIIEWARVFLMNENT